MGAFALLHFAEESFETASTSHTALKYGSHKSTCAFCALFESCTSLQWHPSKGKVPVEITGAPCAGCPEIVESHTCSLQESDFIMETFYLLLLLNNPQLGLFSLSPHLFRICSEEMKKSPCWTEGRKARTFLLTKNPLALSSPSSLDGFFSQTSHVNSLTSLFHLTHLEICVTGDVSALSNLPPLFCSHPWGGGEGGVQCGSLLSSTAFDVDLYLHI